MQLMVKNKTCVAEKLFYVPEISAGIPPVIFWEALHRFVQDFFQ